MIKHLLSRCPEGLRAAVLRNAIALADEDLRFQTGQPTMFGSLRNIERQGFKPGGIVDVGANVGEWTREIAKIFPQVPIHMIEPQPNLEDRLAKVALELPRAHYTMALLGPETKARVPFYVLGAGSSVLSEMTSFHREQINLPMHRLDDLVEVRALPGPLLLKLDVQGFELAVLDGAVQALSRTEIVLCEVALLEYNMGAPLMHDVVAYLAARGFWPYDFCGGVRRSSDKALFQIDMIFARHDSVLRGPKQFFVNEPA